MYFLFAWFTHLFSKECVPFPYETAETKNKCCVCKKDMGSKDK